MNKIIVRIKGGVVVDVEKSHKDIKVEVRDYDIQSDVITKDDVGFYTNEVW